MPSQTGRLHQDNIVQSSTDFTEQFLRKVKFIVFEFMSSKTALSEYIPWSQKAAWVWSCQLIHHMQFELNQIKNCCKKQNFTGHKNWKQQGNYTRSDRKYEFLFETLPPPPPPHPNRWLTRLIHSSQHSHVYGPHNGLFTYMNTCQVSPLEMSPKHFMMATIVF